MRTDRGGAGWWRAAVVAGALAIGAVAKACGGENLVLPGEGEPAVLEVVDGGDQVGTVGAELEDPIRVRLVDTRDRPVVGRSVRFTVVSGGGSVDPDEDETDADGGAETRWRLGAASGAQLLEVRLDADDVSAELVDTIAATAGAGNASRLVVVGGDDQTGMVGSPLRDSLVVAAQDDDGNGVAGVEVSWSAEGGGSVSAARTTTGADGRAGIVRTLGGTPGEQRTVASAEGLEGSPLSFVATALVGSAGRLSIETQPSATARSGAAFERQPRVRLLDDAGNPVPQAGVAVVATIGSGPAGGSLIGSTTAATNSSGIATFSGLGISGPAGAYTITFSGAGLQGATSDGVTVQAGSGSRLVVIQQPSSQIESGETFPRQPHVQLQDAAGNPVEQGGVTVTASLASGGGSLGGTTAPTTDGQGVARFTNLSITGGAGSYTLLFASPGFTSVTSAPLEIAPSGPSGPSASRSTVSASPTSITTSGSSTVTVTVRDGAGGPLSGVNVVPSATGSGNSFSPSSASSNGSGVATFTFRSTATGTKTISATAGGVRIDQTASVTVTSGGGGGGGNTPPAAVDDDYRMQNDERLDERAPGVLRNDIDPDGDALTAKLVSGPSNATRFELRANGSFEYEPRRNFVGRDSFRYRVNDGRVDSENIADVVITVEDD